MAEKISRLRNWRTYTAAGCTFLVAAGLGGIFYDFQLQTAAAQQREQAITAQLDSRYPNYSEQTITNARRTVTIFDGRVNAAEQNAFDTGQSEFSVSVSPDERKAEQIVRSADARQQAEVQLEARYPEPGSTPLGDASGVVTAVGILGDLFVLVHSEKKKRRRAQNTIPHNGQIYSKRRLS